MAYKVTEECINCAACSSDCPNEAIYEPGVNWDMNGQVFGEGDAAPSGVTGFYSDEYYYIVPDKCTECQGFYDEPQCVSVCPNDAVVKI